MRPEPIPAPVAELFDYLLHYAETGNLGVVSTLDKRTGETRFTLLGRHPTPNGVRFVPLGFLSTTAGDEVIAPGAEVDELVLAPELFEVFLAYGSNAPDDIDRWADDGGPA